MAFEPSEKTILIVDDEVDLCEILQFDLEDAGFQTHSANQAYQALDLLQQYPIDLVISDIRMPGGDGIVLLDAIRKKDFQDPPVIFVSGFADISVEEAYHRGVSGIFSKPLCSEKLLEYIQLVLQTPMERWKRRSDWDQSPAFEISCKSLDDCKQNACVRLGRGGIFIRSEGKLPRPGDLIHIKCNIEDRHSQIEGLAICRWLRNRHISNAHVRGIGLEFMELNDESIVLVTKHAESHQMIPYIPME
ncbi:MAG: response regulator [Oligoflexus sp.]